MGGGSQSVSWNGGREDEEKLVVGGFDGVAFMVVGASERFRNLVLSEGRFNEPFAPKIVSTLGRRIGSSFLARVLARRRFASRCFGGGGGRFGGRGPPTGREQLANYFSVGAKGIRFLSIVINTYTHLSL